MNIFAAELRGIHIPLRINFKARAEKFEAIKNLTVYHPEVIPNNNMNHDMVLLKCQGKSCPEFCFFPIKKRILKMMNDIQDFFIYFFNERII